MRARGIVVLLVVLVAALTGGVVASFAISGRRAARGPQQVAQEYFAAWRQGSFTKMARLADAPPADFADQHRALSQGLSVVSVELRPDPVVQSGADQAQASFQVSRDLAGHGTWSFRATLRLGRVDGRWKVLWSPDTLYPGLKRPATWRLTRVEVPAVAFVAADGRALPEGGLLDPYLTELGDRLVEEGDDDEADGHSGWAVEATEAGGKPQRVKLLAVKQSARLRTTIDRDVQAAAERAVQGRPQRTAIVALRPSTGAVLAVADQLGGQGAFVGGYPPGSTFKVVTAGALIADGMGAGSGADCPAGVVAAQRTIRNHEGSALGATTLRGAFAQSCNTTFARLAVDRLGGGKLGRAASAFGFGVRLKPGTGAATGDFPDPRSGAELAEASFGQGRVVASPLMMASVAAAVADGTWRAPRLLAAKDLRKVGAEPGPERDVPGAAALRAMMRAVVTEGTAAGAGLPAGTAGKTGTAEFSDNGDAHAWFIGFKGDLAFAVFAEAGGSGPKVAAPIAARFLRGL
ncbi:penicillin-binding transpeptidase domain-containing protein [Actinomadura macrotermitis]|uniref:Cell division protein FtsI n=1 Tax=Actinomadura macrotermitis TaxID=2585200 RepID=A0A7K0BMS4_9ACTN|nr:penicillin-binding transpeptidase domain-containing protein [Actinomadura macrotermitis]MQY02480.1 hypothetical protein [Actinomadura macrotermitis]